MHQHTNNNNAQEKMNIKKSEKQTLRWITRLSVAGTPINACLLSRLLNVLQFCFDFLYSLYLSNQVYDDDEYNYIRGNDLFFL